MARKFEVPGSPRTKIRAELSSNGSDVRPAGLTPHKKPRRGLMEWGSFSSSPADLIDFRHDVSGSHQNLLIEEGTRDKVVCILMGLTAGNAAGYRSGAINTGIEDFLVLPAVPVVPILPGPALRDGFSHVLGLRIVVPEALLRLFRQLLRRRQSLVVLSYSAGVLYKASCSNLVVPFTIGYGDQTLGGHCCFRRHLAELTFDTSGSKTVVTEILALRGGVVLLEEYFESSKLHKSPWRIYLALSLSTSWNRVLHHEIVHWLSKQTVSKPSAVDVRVVVDHSQESVSTALLQEFCQLTVPGHGRGYADRFPTSATRILVVSSAGRFRMHTSSDIHSRLRELEAELWR